MLNRRKAIVSREGNILGYIISSSNGDMILTPKDSGTVLGKYNASMDVTTDRFGRIISRGNSLAMLIKK